MILVYVSLAAAAYPVFLIALAFLVQPLRIQLFKTGESLLADRRTTPEQRSRLNHMLDSAVAFRVGLILPIAIIGVAIDEALGRHPVISQADKWIESDPRFADFALRYFASIAAANPIGPFLALPAMVLLVAASAFRGMPEMRLAVEESLMRASESTPIPMGLAA